MFIYTTTIKTRQWASPDDLPIGSTLGRTVGALEQTAQLLRETPCTDCSNVPNRPAGFSPVFKAFTHLSAECVTPAEAAKQPLPMTFASAGHRSPIPGHAAQAAASHHFGVISVAIDYTL